MSSFRGLDVHRAHPGEPYVFVEQREAARLEAQQGGDSLRCEQPVTPLRSRRGDVIDTIELGVAYLDITPAEGALHPFEEALGPQGHTAHRPIAHHHEHR